MLVKSHSPYLLPIADVAPCHAPPAVVLKIKPGERHAALARMAGPMAQKASEHKCGQTRADCFQAGRDSEA